MAPSSWALSNLRVLQHPEILLARPYPSSPGSLRPALFPPRPRSLNKVTRDRGPLRERQVNKQFGVRTPEQTFIKSPVRARRAAAPFKRNRQGAFHFLGARPANSSPRSTPAKYCSRRIADVADAASCQLTVNFTSGGWLDNDCHSVCESHV